MPENKVKTILISRIDSIGDVVLTLPMCGLIKKLYPKYKIIFLGRTYTKPVVALSEHVDEFVNWSGWEKLTDAEIISQLRTLQIDIFVHVFPDRRLAKLAKKAGIAERIGTNRRIFHWLFCNRLANLSRKNSMLHEAQLNIELLRSIFTFEEVAREEIKNLYGFTRVPKLEKPMSISPVAGKTNLILHPKSKGSAREWGAENFAKLIALLPPEQYAVFISGTKEEGDMVRETLIKPFPHVTDLTGKFSLEEFISFISQCDVLVAASTGPLHIASALGKRAIGLYAPMRPIFPTRWAPLGEKASFLVMNKSCDDCRKSMDCACIRAIGAGEVATMIRSN